MALKNVILPIIAIFFNCQLLISNQVSALELVRVRNFNVPYDNETQYPVLDFIGLVEPYGYKAEEVFVTTKDKYILTLHRIVSSPACPNRSNKTVVYLQHGILLSSDSWVLTGPKSDLAFLLADACYDVWLGNVRGNTYSKNHVNKNISDSEFWDFSYHEMAIYDLRAFIDHILLITKQKDLIYIGYSMGTTISYVLLSELQKYNKLIKKVYSLSPVVYWENTLRPIPDSVNKLFWLTDAIVKVTDVREVFKQTALNAKIGENFCTDESVLTQPACVKAFASIGLDPESFNRTALPNILAHFPAGTSIKNVYHYNQNFNTHTFRAYNHTLKENLKRYNQTKPPTYDLGKITAPIYIWAAENDDIINYKDVELLVSRLGNVKSFQIVNDIKFNHFDFLWSLKVKKLVYDPLIKSMNE